MVEWARASTNFFRHIRAHLVTTGLDPVVHAEATQPKRRVAPQHGLPGQARQWRREKSISRRNCIRVFQTTTRNLCLLRMIPKSGVRFSDEIMRQEREAERRQAHPTMSAPHSQALPPESARARMRSQRGPLASRRSDRGACRANQCHGSAQATLRAIGRVRALPAPSNAPTAMHLARRS